MTTDLVPHERQPVITAESRMMALLGYLSLLIGLPLFILPLAMRKDAFAMYHARQAGALFVISLFEGVLFALITLMTCGIGVILLPILFLPWIGAAHGVYLVLTDRQEEPVLTFGLGEKWFGSIRPQ